MDTSTQRVAAAFHGCRSGTGSDRASDDARGSSGAGVWSDGANSHANGPEARVLASSNCVPFDRHRTSGLVVLVTAVAASARLQVGQRVAAERADSVATTRSAGRRVFRGATWARSTVPRGGLDRGSGSSNRGAARSGRRCRSASRGESIERRKVQSASRSCSSPPGQRLAELAAHAFAAEHLGAGDAVGVEHEGSGTARYQGGGRCVLGPARAACPIRWPRRAAAGTPINPNDKDPKNIRALTQENESADALAKAGYKVEQNPATQGNKNPNYLIEDKVFDNYAPGAKTSPHNIWSNVKEKVEAEQTHRVVINLSDCTGDFNALRNQFSTFRCAAATRCCWSCPTAAS